jgi:hypothetical protein
MMDIYYNNFTDFLVSLPLGPPKSVDEESRNLEIPNEWTKLGTLKDERLHPSMYSYKLWTHYALGFYPFNDCDIFRDENGRILLSYVEYGGHAPFRRSFIAGSNAPIIEQPVGFKLWINKNHHKDFLKYMAQKGFTGERITKDLQKFEDKRKLSDELKSDEWHLLRRDSSTSKDQIIYTMIAPRKKAAELSHTWNDKP